ncbi:unnamed protein product, partial [Ixodes pacificus]
VDTYKTLSACQLLEKIRRYAVGFQQHGVKPGSRVCAHIGNGVENVAAAFGVVFAGGTLVMAKPASVARELVYIIEDSHCTFLLVDEQTAPNVAKFIIPTSVKAVFAVGSVPSFIDVLQFEELSDASFKPHVPTDNEEEVVVVVYTSGSTGLPKGVELSHKAFCAAFHGFRYADRNDVVLAWNPITHVSGLAYDMNCVLIGAKTVIAEPWISYEEFKDTLETFQVSLLIVHCCRMQHVVNEARKNKDSEFHVKKVIVGGSMITKALGKGIREIFNVESIATCYGLTETFGVLSISPVGHLTFDDCGFPVAGSKVKVIDLTSGNSLGPHQKGEIMVHSQSVMKGYIGRPEATAEALSDEGWLRTGDLGLYDTDGRIHIIDRLKEMIKCMDNAVTPAELEELLLTHEAVAEAAVVGVPSPKYGEAPAACVVVKDGFDKNLERLSMELKQLIADQAAVFKQLYGGVFFMKSLPKSQTGKI